MVRNRRYHERMAYSVQQMLAEIKQAQQEGRVPHLWNDAAPPRKYRKANPYRVGPGHGDESGQYTSRDDPRAVIYRPTYKNEPPAKRLQRLGVVGVMDPREYAGANTAAMLAENDRNFGQWAATWSGVDEKRGHDHFGFRDPYSFIIDKRPRSPISGIEDYLADAPGEVHLVYEDNGEITQADMGNWEIGRSHYVTSSHRMSDVFKRHFLHNHPGGAVHLSGPDVAALFQTAGKSSTVVSRVGGRLAIARLTMNDSFVQFVGRLNRSERQLFVDEILNLDNQLLRKERASIQTLHMIGERRESEDRAVFANLTLRPRMIEELNKQFAAGTGIEDAFTYEVWLEPIGKGSPAYAKENPWRIRPGYPDSGQYASEDDPRAHRYPVASDFDEPVDKPSGVEVLNRTSWENLPKEDELLNAENGKYKLEGGDELDVNEYTRQEFNKLGANISRADYRVIIDGLPDPGRPGEDIERWERKIEGAPMETVLIYDDNGNPANFEWGGWNPKDGHHAFLPDDLTHDTAWGMNLTHNHPSGSLFPSKPDLDTMFVLGLKRVRIVTKNKYGSGVGEVRMADWLLQRHLKNPGMTSLALHRMSHDARSRAVAGAQNYIRNGGNWNFANSMVSHWHLKELNKIISNEWPGHATDGLIFGAKWHDTND